jgi:histidinol dehydrogenase
LIIATDHPEAVADHVLHAGSVFLGPYSCESMGDYASGTNHTLPTAGWARSYSGVSLDSFFRKITFQHITAQGIRSLGPVVETLATAESLEAHATAVSVRLASLQKEKL